MKNNNQEDILPLMQLISFNKLLAFYDEQAKSKNELLANRAKEILKVTELHPELREGFSDMAILEEKKNVVHTILADSFAPVLTTNEIKIASIPYHNLVFNATERFNTILKDAGEDFELEMRKMTGDEQYVMMATVILSFYYGFNLDYRRPLFYDIPDKNGVMRHYRILYNADFMEIIPTKEAKKLTQKDVDELLSDADNIELWKEKIPPKSFTAKGFVICNMFDVTADHSISEIKSSLIGRDKRKNENFMESFQDTFRSLFNLKDISVGFSGYEDASNRFFKIYGKGIDSFILGNREAEYCDSLLCDYSTNQLNGINAIKLEDVMPYIVSAVLRSIEEEHNLIDAIIQNECTTVHSSVYWKFQEEAKHFMTSELQGNQAVFKEIVFKDVFPLYGQIDIKDSSKERNLAIQRDLMIQLSEIQTILNMAFSKLKLPIYEELMFRVNNHLEEIKDTLYTHSEQAVFDFVQEEINPAFHHLKREDKKIKLLIENYEQQIDGTTESYYDHRRNYDESVMKINMKLAALLDKKQHEAQTMFPHYFERYKTDGVEHNMYIGSSIANDRAFDELYLNNLRLWQLQTMVEMENKHYSLKPNLPVQLDVASLLLIYSTPLAIRFRMDEKKFDVDGTYNARYEIIKKRIDKSNIKGTNERLTQKGKLAIVYSQKKDEKEYLRYVKFLKAKGYFTNNIEIVELDGLQGVTGLKAIRAEILYKTDATSEKTYTYDDLMEELKN